jgi:small GTP-binding protein
MDGLPADNALKVIILGEASVGKTSIINQWLYGSFTFDTKPTVGAGLSPVQLMVDGAVQAFHVWDTAGTPQYRDVVPMYCRSAAIAIIVFDLSQAASFEKVEEWYNFVREAADPVLMLIGNKLDLTDQRAVDGSAADALAERLSVRYLEVSACTGEGMNDFGRTILDCARESRTKMMIASPTLLVPSSEPGEPPKCNC